MKAPPSTAGAFGAVLTAYLALKNRQMGPNLRQVGEIIDEWLSAKSKSEASNKEFGTLFNPLALVPLRETIHSRIIGELLNPHGDHGQRALFLQCLLRYLEIPEPNVGEWWLTCEEDRIDLKLERTAPASVILIENKANDAEDRPNQLYRYWHRQVYRRYPKLAYDHVQTRRSYRIIYLSRDGKKMPEPHSLTRPDGWKGINPAPIYEEDGEKAQQYETDTGPLDILAISKDKKRLLVVELKKGRASDAVVGQTLRYMSYVAEELAEDGQTVLGAIIAHEDDKRIRRALALTPSIAFYRYEVSFKLQKV